MKTPVYITRHSKKLKIILIVETVLLLSISTYYYFEYAKKVPVINTDILNTQPVEFDFSTLQYTPSVDVVSHYSLSNLEILPSNYDSVTSVLGDLSQHQKTELLLYSQTTQASDMENLSTAYQYLNEKGLNIFIPQKDIDTYFLNKIYSISKGIYDLDVNKATKSRLDELIGIKDTTYIDNCTSKDISDILSKNSCNLDTTLSTVTLPHLYTWLLFSQEENGTEYDEYISRHAYLYTLNQGVKDSAHSTSEISQYYLDTDISHLYKLKYTLEFLEDIYSQTELKDTPVETEMSVVKNYIWELIQYTEKNLEQETNLDTLVEDIISSTAIEFPKEPENEISNISWHMKSFNTGSSNEIYVSPIYIFKDTTEENLLTFTISDENFSDSYEVVPRSQKSSSSRVPILMYHQIKPLPLGASSFQTGLYVDPLDFEKQLAYLVKHNYKTITPKELYEILKTGGNPTQKSVMLTFDDSVRNHYTTAYPLLKKYGLKGVFYIVSNRSSISSSELKEMAENGMSIDSHSATHINLQETQDTSKLSYEILSSKSQLSARTGKPVYSIAYPGCVASREAYQYVGSAGYLIGVSCGRSIDHYFSNRLSLSRVHVFTDMKSFVDLLSGIN